MKQLLIQDYFVLHYRRLEELIKEFYGQEYSFVAQEELHNDTAKSFLAGRRLDEWGEKDVKEFKKTGKIGGYSTAILLDDMANRKFIPLGRYLIEVSW